MTDPTYRQLSLWIEGYQSAKNAEESTIRSLRERLQHSGVQSLSNAELVSLVLRTATGSESIIEHVQTMLNTYSLQELLQVDFDELYRKHRLSDAKAAQLQAFLETARRLTLPPPSKRYQIICAQDAAKLVTPDMAFLDHEEMRILVLDTKNQVVANVVLYKGTVNSSVARVAEIFHVAVTRKCPGVIICHNHPSGSTEPSQEDIELTKLCVAAGKILEIELVDHLIIGAQSFLSLRERLLW
jgi:DNA repair protein RadC